MNPEIIDAIKIRDRYKSLNNDNQHKIWRNKVASLIKQSKKAQYSALINENNNNPGSVWKLFKEIGIKRKNNTSKIPSLKNGNNCTEEILKWPPNLIISLCRLLQNQRSQ